MCTKGINSRPRNLRIVRLGKHRNDDAFACGGRSLREALHAPWRERGLAVHDGPHEPLNPAYGVLRPRRSHHRRPVLASLTLPRRRHRPRPPPRRRPAAAAAAAACAGTSVGAQEVGARARPLAATAAAADDQAEEEAEYDDPEAHLQAHQPALLRLLVRLHLGRVFPPPGCRRPAALGTRAVRVLLRPRVARRPERRRLRASAHGARARRVCEGGARLRLGLGLGVGVG